MKKICTYEVTLTVEHTITRKVRGRDEEHAMQRAEEKLRKSQGRWKGQGYSLGDVHFHDARYVRMNYDSKFKESLS
ncbi:MAG: hypothetical protein CMQ88_04145 [Gammaproteobacteria bacterium]|nr:hypothetical protein [Gammaproteobacteria bacterium]